MWHTLLAVLWVIWPPVAAWIVLKLLPSSISKFVEKEIDRRSDTKLERIKAELQGSYSTLKSSVDVLTASSSGLHPHIIEAVSALWTAIVSMREKFCGVVAFDTLTLKEEAEACFAEDKHPQILEYVRSFEGELHENALLREFNALNLDAQRLFCGDRLWLIFYVYRAVTMRSAMLISLSFKKKIFQDWREDGGIDQLLSTVLKPDAVKKVRESKFNGLADGLSRLEAEFLHEATRVMSGSKAMADSLADVQALMLLQNAKIAEGRK